MRVHIGGTDGTTKLLRTVTCGSQIEERIVEQIIQIVDFYENKWVCGRCGIKESTDRSVCGRCGTPRS